MKWWEFLLLLLPGVPATVLLLIFLSVIKTHVQVYVDGQPAQKKYLVCLENLDDVASREEVRMELRIRGPGEFKSNRLCPLGFAPWPASVQAEFQKRTAVLTAKGMGRHERWLFKLETDGHEQGVEVLCRIGRRELPVIASDGVAEYTDNPGASPFNAWMGLGLSPLLYLGLVAASRVVQDHHPRLEWVDAAIALGVLCSAAFSLWVMRQSRQAVVAHPSIQPAFPPSTPPAREP